MSSTAMDFEERPRLGDRVKLIGNHSHAGAQGVYIGDRAYYDGGALLPVVKLPGIIEPVSVADPDNQMRKL